MDRSHLMIYVFQKGYFIENIIHRDERLFLLLRSVSDGAMGSFWRWLPRTDELYEHHLNSVWLM